MGQTQVTDSMVLDPGNFPVVAVLGAAAADTITRVAEFPPPDGIVLADTCMTMPGGSGGNVAEGVARLGYPTRFLGVLGDDGNGDLLLRSFRDAGVDTRAIRVLAGQRSAACLIVVNSRGERMIFSLGGAALYDDPKDIQPEWLQDVKLLYITDAYLHVALAAMEILNAEAKVVFNPGGLMITMGATQLQPLLDRTQVLITSQVEATELTDLADPQRAAHMLAELGPPVVIVTLGANGALLYTDGMLIRAAAIPVPKVADTTGAGDAFSVGVIAGMMEGFDWTATLSLASEVAARKIQCYGSRVGLPYRNEVNSLVVGNPQEQTGRKP